MLPTTLSRRMILAAVIGLVSTAGALIAMAAGKDDAAADKSKELDGTWIVESIARNLDEQAAGNGAGVVVTIADQRAMVKAPGDDNQPGKLVIKIDPAQKPPTIDVWNDDSPFGKSVEEIVKETPILGVYELDGDRLKVCIAPLETRTRPTQVAADPASGHTLVVMKREKK